MTNGSGYGRPPKRTQFVKGQSGNPKGRPKGSQSLSTLLQKLARERIIIKVEGMPRKVSKLEAAIMQMLNKAASGDQRAAGDLLYWLSYSEKTEQQVLLTSDFSEADHVVIAGIVQRVHESQQNNSGSDATHPEITDIPERKED